MAAFWNAGTITLTENSAAVTGQGTDFLGSTARAGDTIESDDGRRATIASINSATSITLDKPWRGTGQTAAAYKLWFTPDDVILEGQGRRALANLSSGNITALSGLVGAANKLPFFTGEGTMDTTDLTAKGREIIGAADSAAARQAIGALAGPLSASDIPANLTPDKAFRRGNILGNVGQSGGVPTGAIIERGSNSNGEYVRYADGTQICWGFSVQLTRTSTPTMTGSWSFPANFSSSNVSVFFTINEVLPASSRECSARATSSATGSNLQLLQNSSWDSALVLTAMPFAIGRWF